MAGGSSPAGWRGWPGVRVQPDGGGGEVDAIAPLIISASRSTDIPAFYGDWFMERLRRGYARWINPWNGIPRYVSLGNARAFVFWSKNPAPFLSRLDELTHQGYRSYTLFTLNDYVAEGLEPGVPPLEDRVRTFRALSRKAGRERVIWRCDPLLLTGELSVGGLLERIGALGDAVAPFTDRMIISFIDIAKYPKVARNLAGGGFSGVREFTPAEEEELAAGLRELNRSWGLGITACGEKRDLSRHGIGQGQCISYDLLVRECGDDPVLREFLGEPGPDALAGKDALLPTPARLKDPGQRSACGCAVSKDIGQYGTCPHLCAYCYANPSPVTVRRRYKAYRERAAQGIFGDSIAG
jgi:hypothetical protein